MASLLDLSSNDLRNQLAGQLAECAACRLPLNNLSHLLSDRSDLRAGSVCGLLDLVRSSLGERNGEESEKVIICGLNCDVGFDESLPLANEGAKFIGGEIKAMEVSQAVLALNFIHAELDLPEGVVFVGLKVGERNFEDTTFEGVVGVFDTSCAVHEGFADTGTLVSVDQVLVGWARSYSRTLNVDGAWIQLAIAHLLRAQLPYLDRVPILAHERVLGSLLEALLAFRKALVPAHNVSLMYPGTPPPPTRIQHKERALTFRQP